LFDRVGVGCGGQVTDVFVIWGSATRSEVKIAFIIARKEIM